MTVVKALAFGALVVGAVVGYVGYKPIFILLAVFDLIGAAVLWSFVRVKLDEIISPARASEAHPALVDQ